MSVGQSPLRSADQIREPWSKTYNADGKPDWSRIFPRYRDDIAFRDSIQSFSGTVDFEAMLVRLFGSMRLLLAEDRLIYEQRDYYDLWGDIFDNIPWIALPYRRFMRKRLG